MLLLLAADPVDRTQHEAHMNQSAQAHTWREVKCSCRSLAGEGCGRQGEPDAAAAAPGSWSCGESAALGMIQSAHIHGVTDCSTCYMRAPLVQQ
jgi:hypothetical protein